MAAGASNLDENRDGVMICNGTNLAGLQGQLEGAEVHRNALAGMFA